MPTYTSQQYDPCQWHDLLTPEQSNELDRYHDACFDAHEAWAEMANEWILSGTDDRPTMRLPKEPSFVAELKARANAENERRKAAAPVVTQYIYRPPGARDNTGRTHVMGSQYHITTDGKTAVCGHCEANRNGFVLITRDDKTLSSRICHRCKGK